MKKVEFEKKIKELNVKRIYFNNRPYEYEFSRNFYDDDKENIYGCYYNGHEYIIFFKDIERGVTSEIDRFRTEDEAYDSLYERIVKWLKKREQIILLSIMIPAIIIMLIILIYIIINL